MVIQHKENFVTYDNITKTTNFATTNPAQTDGVYPSGVVEDWLYTTSLPNVFSDGKKRTLYGRINVDIGGTGTAADQIASIFLSDGINWVIFGLDIDTGLAGQKLYMNYFAGRSFNATNRATTDSNIARDVWHWFKIEVESDDSIKFYWVENHGTIKPNDADWLHVSAFDVTVSLGAISEIGCFFRAGAGQNTDDVHAYDDLEIIVGEGIPIENTTFGDGTGGTIQLSSVYVKKTVGQVGSKARLTYHDPLLSKAAQVEASHRTVTTISETKFNTRMLQGEIVNSDTMIKEIIVNGVEAKLSRIIAAYDPVFTRGVVEYIEENVMYKQNVGTNTSPVFSSYGTLTDKLVVFIKTNPRIYQCGVNAVTVVDSGDNIIVPDFTSGSRLNLFFDAPEESDANRSLYYRNDGRFFVTLTFVALVKDTSVINKANISVHWASSSRVIANEPKMDLWDFTNSVWRSFTDNEHRDLTTDLNEGNDDGFIESIVVNQQVNIEKDITTGVVADYSNVSAVNNLGWKTHTYKIRLDTGTTILPINKEIIHIEEANLKLDLDIDQQYQVGVGKIQTVNDHNLVFYGNGAISWLDEDIRNDGISGGGVDENGLSIGDEYYITDKISDILEALWVASGADQIMNLNVTITSEIPDIEDLRRVMILQYVQKVSELQGLIYFTSYTADPTNDLPTFNITDTPVNSGLILTDSDFIEPLNQTTYKIDSSKELSTLKLVGKNGIIGTVSISSEHTPELGLETVLVARPDIHTARQAGAWLSKKKLLYTNAYRYFSCRINYDRANQDYSLLDIGKEVSVKNPADASIVDHQAGTNGRLLIYQLELNRNWNNGYSNIITLILQQRFT